MAIVSCECGSRFAAAPHLAGTRVSCPQCSRPIDIPRATPEAARPVVVTCSCGGRFQAPASLVGTTVPCPSCRQELLVGGATQVPAMSDFLTNPAAGRSTTYGATPSPTYPGATYPGPTYPSATGYGGPAAFPAATPPFSSAGPTKAATPKFSQKFLIIAAAVGGGLVVLLLLGVFVPRLFAKPELWKGNLAAAREAGPAGVAPRPTVRSPDSQEPKTAAELEAYYRLPPGKPDATQAWLGATSPFGEEAYEREAAKVPLLAGASGKPYPAPGDYVWGDLDQGRRLVDRYRAELRQLRHVAASGEAPRYPTNFAQGIEMLLPYADAIRPAHKLLKLEAYVHAHDGDPSATADSLLTSMALSETVGQQPISIMQVLRFGFAETHRCTAELASTAKFSDDDLTKLKYAVSQINYDDGLYLGLLGDRVLLPMAFDNPRQLQMIAEVSLQRENRNGSGVAQLFASYSTASVERDRRVFVSWMDRYLAASRRPWPEKLKFLTAISADVKTARDLPLEERPRLALLLLPAIDTYFFSAARAVASRDGAMTALAIEQYRRKQGKLPERLEQLVPDYLREIPRDPFDGAHLRYLTTKTDYLLYSCGENLRDDGGDDVRENPPDDFVMKRTKDRDWWPTPVAKQQPERSPAFGPIVGPTVAPVVGPTVGPAVDPFMPTGKRLLSVEDRKTIYLQITRDFAEIRDFILDDDDEDAEEAMKEIAEDEQDAKEHMCFRFQIPPEQLEEIIAEGNSQGWPKGKVKGIFDKQQGRDR